MKKIICTDRKCIHNDALDDSCSILGGKIIIKKGKCTSKVKGK